MGNLHLAVPGRLVAVRKDVLACDHLRQRQGSHLHVIDNRQAPKPRRAFQLALELVLVAGRTDNRKELVKALTTGLPGLAALADESQEVYLVPAFVGLGAPYWDADCRGAIYGLSRGTGRAELACATLESVCYQTCDLLNAMHRDWDASGNTILRVDGGMVASDWTMQRLADLVNAEVDRPRVLETTALGAAWLGGMQSGFYGDEDEFSQSWGLDERFQPEMDDTTRSRKYAGWQDAVKRTLSQPS